MGPGPLDANAARQRAALRGGAAQAQCGSEPRWSGDGTGHSPHMRGRLRDRLSGERLKGGMRENGKAGYEEP